VAEALGADEATAKVEYRAWADGQHDMLRWTDGRLGRSGAEYAEVLSRAGEPDPGAAQAHAATHRVLCAHADQDGQDTHWLQPGENCAAPGPGQAGRGILAPDAAASYAAMPEATGAAGPEAGS
jgi:hypothetical protein